MWNGSYTWRRVINPIEEDPDYVGSFVCLIDQTTPSVYAFVCLVFLGGMRCLLLFRS